MLSNILSMEGVAVLDKKQQRAVNGGVCAYYNGSTGEVNYHVTSSSAAQGMLTNANDHYCCSSCGSASWYHYDCPGQAGVFGPNHNDNCMEFSELE